MMALRIIIGVVVVVAISAWAFYIDNKGVKNTDEPESADDTSKEE